MTAAVPFHPEHVTCWTEYRDRLGAIRDELGTEFFTAQDNQVASQSVTIYDGVGRVTNDVLMSNSVEQSRTTTAYGGDHNDVTPPTGGTPTTTVFDARGQKPADTQCLDNDDAGRLVQAWTPGNCDCDQQPTAAAMGGPAPYWQTWQIDAAGNRLNQTDHNTANGDVSTTYNYPAAGITQAHTVQSTSTTDTTGTHTATYAYDAGGNTISRPGPHGQQTLTWDDSGHLDPVTDTSGTSSYVYTPTGNRLISHDPTGTTLTLNSLELHLAKGKNAVTATHYFTFNGDTIAQRTSGGVTWLSADLQGSAQIAVDAVTQNVTRRRATPYGGPRGPQPVWGNDCFAVQTATDGCSPVSRHCSTRPSVQTWACGRR